MSKKAASTKGQCLQQAGELEKKLEKGGGPFLAGAKPGKEDGEAMEKLLGQDHQAIGRWVKNMNSYTKEERKAFPAKDKVPKFTTVTSATGPTKAERKAAFAAGEGTGVRVVAARKEATKGHKDALEKMPDHPNFSKREEEVAARWVEIDAFQTSVKQSEGKKPFTFYDGPPFATGLPHYGHILAGTIKDVVCRWAHQTGHHVERRFGWDCHGLPIEFEIEKKLGIKTSHDVMKIGIKAYNQHCREIVMKFSSEWEKTVTRMGRWIDFKNDYKTMNLSYMESVWWVFNQLWEKKLVYRGYKVMPYSFGCTTVLSNFEANMNYKQVSDPALVVTFPWTQDESINFLAWTTTPWTLPSNLMLCVNPTMKYVLIEDVANKAKYILAEARLIQIYPQLKKKPKELPYKVLETYTGKDLVGREYKPLFNFFDRKKKDGCFRIIEDAYVTSDAGTGIVHQAPGFGEDDYRCCLAAGVIQKNEDIPCPVDANGCFTEEVADWAGVRVKEADKDIQKKLKDSGRLVRAETIKHDYPFCWRSEQPLIYKAVSSWFVNVEQIKDQLVKNNKDTYWVPESVQVGRFNNWLESARDWAVSRNRYWGTPLPIWVSEDYEQRICIDSVEKLEKLTGKKITDIHRDSVDDLLIPDPRGDSYPPLKRVPEVFDCWFESGSMPYAQSHYPFENKDKFQDGFPADFIAEGIDQTRGWFYTLLVLSTAVFGKPPFKNLVVNGLILAEDGHKMSKSKQNYPPPTEIIDQHGADALRLYLINSPVVKGQDLKFTKDNVKKVVGDVLLPLHNVVNFFTINHERLLMDGETFDADVKLTNVMDRWITAASEKLVKGVTEEMKKFHLYTVVPVVLKWVDNLTNCYLRMNRSRMKGGSGVEDQKASLATMFNVLMTTARVMAAFTPFMSELIYQQIKPLAKKEIQMDSVHYLMVPDAVDSFDDVVIRKVERLQEVNVMVRTIRDRKGVGIRKPVREVIVINNDPVYVADIEELVEYVKEEVHAFEVKCTAQEEEYVIVRAEGNSKTLGPKFGKDRGAIVKEIQKRDTEVAKIVMKEGKVEVAGHMLDKEDIKLVREFKPAVTEGYDTFTDGNTLVLVDMTQSEDVLIAHSVREVRSRIQQLRKRAKLEISDKVIVFYATEDDHFQKAFDTKCDELQAGLGASVLPLSQKTADHEVLVEVSGEDSEVTLVLVRA